VAVKKKPAKTTEYGAKQITVLEGLEPVRKRPGMYIGSTGPTGLHHLIWEVVDNAIDEAMAGHASRVTLRLLSNNRISVEDDGRGIPVDPHPQYKVSALELVLTKLHAGGKFGGEGSGYKVSGGLHGVGVSVVNALSSYLKADVYRDGYGWSQEYKQGKPTSKVRRGEKTRKRGTVITFEPDATIFESVEFSFQTILERFRQQAYLTKAIHLIAIDERPETSAAYGFYFEGGVASYVKFLNRSKTAKHENVLYVNKEDEETKIAVEVAFQYTEEYHETLFCFTNNIINLEGGTHMVGFRTALTRELNTYARTKGYIKEKDQNLTGEDVREGLTAVVSIKMQEPQFEGQTKGKLGTPQARTSVESIFGEALKIFLEEHPRDAEAIIGKCVLASRARAAARAARETVLRKGVLEGLTLPGKLADCSSKDASTSELFIVEGDSAGGCFSGETEVALTDGRNLSFVELEKEWKAGKTNYCYTIMENDRVGIAPVRDVRCTKKNARVVQVMLDDNSTITCTPDHKFLLRSGEYCEAQNLKQDTSLMPLRRQLSKKGKRITIEGYEMVFDPSEMRWLFTHVLADEYNLRTGTYTEELNAHRHHIDNNKRNNNPDNLLRLSKEKHLEHHRKLAHLNLHRPDIIEKVRQIHQTPAFREKIRAIMKSPKMRALLSGRAKAQWTDPTYKQFMLDAWHNFFQTHPEYQQKNNKTLDQAQQLYWNSIEHREAQSERTRNFFQKHPEQRQTRSVAANTQWSDPLLCSWRRQETKKQWTTDFRKTRKHALDMTYVTKALCELYWIHGETGIVDETRYEAVRATQNDKSLLRFDTILNRYFKGDRQQLTEAVINYNHRVVSVSTCEERCDVYDLEVPKTHNFALAAGVFVHNSAKQGRNRHYQAILPLRGKILNVERARLDKMLANNELKNLIIAMGTNIGEQFDIAALRYHRIVIMTDADVDGAHIRTLLLTIFYRHFPELIRNGYIYIAKPPLFRVQVGKDVRYAYAEMEKEKIILELTKGKGAKVTEVVESVDGAETTETTTGVKVNVQRYKGLGEMNPEQLWETTMNPETRTMDRVTVDDAEAADQLFDILMGADVAPRKRFIQTHAKSVANLDI